MTDRPMIFSAPMITALLAGRKTQTRRIVKPPKPFDYGDDIDALVVTDQIKMPCQIGERYWVREAHALVPASAYRMSEGVWQAVNPDDPDRGAVYRQGFDGSTGGLRWRPSIHMPRWASRITLVVTDVRAERVQDISEEDAQAEGARPAFTRTTVPDWPVFSQPCCRWSFEELWDEIHGPDAWDRNDWVWRIAFTVHARNIDRMEEGQ